MANTSCPSLDDSAPFWWLLFHLDMLIFAPASKKQRNGLSIHATIRDRIDAAFCGDIAFLFSSAMQVRRLTQNSSSTYANPRNHAQLAADNDDFRTAVSRACASQSVASIGPHHIVHVNKLYTQPVPPLGHPPPAYLPPHQPYSLPGDICDTIRHAAKDKGTGLNADSIDVFTSLLKHPTPSTEDDVRFLFNLIYQNSLPESVKCYFTDVYLFCLHKDPKDHTKLRPLGIPTAIRCLICTHVARTLRDKFATHLLPFNFAVGVPDGSDFVVKAMQLAIEKFIDRPQQQQALPTRAAVFFDLTNQFNSVSREEFTNVIATSFPELLPLVTLFYNKPNTVHFKWNDGSWRRLFMEEGASQGCPLSPLFASFVVARLLAPIDSLLRARAAARLASGDVGDDGYGGISHLLSFVDDISSCVFLPDLEFLCQELNSRGAKIGCFVNPSKTRILTSCDGSSILPRLSTHNPTLATSLSNTIARFSITSHPTDTAAPPVPVELTSGCRLLGHPVGSAAFATDFFASRITAIQRDIDSLHTNICDLQTRLRLFSQCTLQKIPHLLSTDVLYHLPLDDDDPPWEEWAGPLTAATDRLINDFFTSLLSLPSTPERSILISQISLRHGGLGILCPRTRAAPDFVITMKSALRNASHGFRIHKHLPSFQLHSSLGDLFDLTSNPDSLILRRFHILLPRLASIACPPSIPSSDRVEYFLQSVSPHSARARFKNHCSVYLTNSLYQDVHADSPEHFHLLPSLLSPQTSYPIIGMCRSLPSNRIANWEFSHAIRRKLRLPLFPPTSKPYCACGTHLDPFGDHLFQCKRICKIGAHNFIRDGFARALTPALFTAGFLPPGSSIDIEPQLCLPSDPHARPFDLSFDPHPAVPPHVHHGCSYSTVGADITISCPPPVPSFDPASPDVIHTVTANAASHLQTYEKRKLGRVNKRNPSTNVVTTGNDLLGDLLTREMLLLPFAIDPFGRFGPLLEHFLFGSHNSPAISFPASKPNATKMYSRLLQYPSPKGVLLLAEHNWRNSPTRRFYDNSYLAPTPSITTIQKLGLSVTKAFALHIQYASRKFIDRPVHTPTVDVPNPTYVGQ